MNCSDQFNHICILFVTSLNRPCKTWCDIPMASLIGTCICCKSVSVCSTPNTFQMYKVMYVLMWVAPSNVDGHWERCPCDNLSWHSLAFSIVAAFAQCAYIVYCASNVDGHWESYPCDAPLTLASVSLTHPALDSNVLFKQKTKLQNATILQIPMPYIHCIIQCVSERAVVNITYSLEPEILESSNLFHLRRGEC